MGVGSSSVSPVLGALETAPYALRTLSSPISAELATGRFQGVAFWKRQLSRPETSGMILLAPAGLTNEDREPLADALTTGEASAVMIPPENAEAIALWPEVAPFAVILDPTADWSDMAGLLRALCAPKISASTSVVEQGNLFSLAQSLASLAGGAISIADTVGRILGYSTHADQPIDEMRRQSTLTLREASDPSESADYQELFRSAHALWFPAKGQEMSRAALPVRAGSELLGIVWLLADGEQEGEAGRAFLDSVAGLIAHHMVLARESTNFAAQRSSDLLRTILENTAFRAGAMSELGMQPGLSYRAIAFTTANPLEENLVLHAQRQLHHIWLTARSMFAWSEAAILGDQMVCLISEASDSLADLFANRVVATSSTQLVSGISRGGTDPASIASSIKESMAIARLLRSSRGTSSSVASIDTMRERIGLKRLSEHLPDTGMVANDSVELLLKIDADQGSALARTLHIYLFHLGSVARTALELQVHENTVRYRLEHIQRATGVDIAQPHVRLWMWLRLYSIFDQ